MSVGVVANLPNRCPDCGESFPTPQGLGAHRNKKHGYRRDPNAKRAAVKVAIPADITAREVAEVVAFVENSTPEAVFASVGERWVEPMWKNSIIRNLVLTRRSHRGR